MARLHLEGVMLGTDLDSDASPSTLISAAPGTLASESANGTASHDWPIVLEPPKLAWNQHFVEIAIPMPVNP